MSNGCLEAYGHDGWRLRGTVDIHSAEVLQRRALELFYRHIPDTIDLAEVEHVDSAGVALLVDWKRRARLSGKDVRLSNAPPFLGRIAALYSLCGPLGLPAPGDGR